ncbi:radical SAM protein [uncultured Alistipes sp.]|uniref:radical SAM protein n=1 Tax=uncultured Alistipes sp. TaxID=538949 RepID=UPI002621ECB7|nr:radical SAM protein [uncultured Alistipes sp.]
MSTALFDKVIFGPIRSRRLGLSLGVNLLPLNDKLCSFDCIYCECGWARKSGGLRFHPREAVRDGLRRKLEEMAAEGTLPDVITFAGNGEPTMHPDFGAIVDDTLVLRDELCPDTKISVLSNATMIDRDEVFEALLKVDNNILKLDSAFDETVRLIDRPKGGYSVQRVVEGMKRFEGRLIVQTMFLRGTFEGRMVDNTTPRETEAWLRLIGEIAPRQVMIYTIDRDTPAPDLHKVPVEELRTIAGRVEALGIPCSVAG